MLSPPMLSSLDLAMIKIDRLEKEDARKEIRLTALRCRLTELLDNPTIVFVKENGDEVMTQKQAV
tara:strand:- start:1708 stop:1902 length:195 start_codon:yes stop_codon:yes gene_type:complete